MINKLFALTLFLFSMSFVCCSSDDESEQENVSQEEDVRYYVKYEMEMPSLHINVTKDISFVSENGSETFNTMDKTWEGTYGPLKKGTKLYLNVVSRSPTEYSYSQTNNHARIYVSRDKEPFVIKAEDTGKHDISLSYTIDF